MQGLPLGETKSRTRYRAATGRPPTASGFLAQYIAQASSPVGASQDRGPRHQTAGEAYAATRLLAVRPARRAFIDKSC